MEIEKIRNKEIFVKDVPYGGVFKTFNENFYMRTYPYNINHNDMYTVCAVSITSGTIDIIPAKTCVIYYPHAKMMVEVQHQNTI